MSRALPKDQTLKLHLPLLLLSLLLCTCDRAPIVETDEEGFRTKYYLDADSLREGIARRYFPTGSLQSEENYVEGRLHGTRTAYFPDGGPEIVENYEDGQFEGEYLIYDSTGYLRLRGNYEEGIAADIWKRYYPDGGLIETVTFADNRENGPFREWYATGRPH